MSRTYFVLLIVTLTVYSCVAENEQNLNSSRSARQWDIPRDLRLMGRLFFDQPQQQQQHTRRPAPPQILPRSDHFPQKTDTGSVPASYGRPPFARPPPPHMRRRVYSGPPGPPPPGLFLRPNGVPPYPPSFKNTRFSLAKDPYAHKGAPLNYRPGPGHNPNAIPETHNFKPSPNYNGEVIVRRPSVMLPVQKSDDRVEALRRFKQHPIPQDPDHAMYSVHEDTDSEGDSSFGYQNIGENAMKQAKQYLNFMSSNEYFLPKVEPDYRKLDQSKQQQQQKKKSSDNAALSSSPLQHYQQQQQQHHPQQQQQQQKQQRNVESSSSLNTAFTVNAPLRVSSSYSQAQAHQAQANSANSFSNSYPAQAIVGSFQGGNKDFVVSSDGKKNVQSIASTSFSSADASNHHQQRQNSPIFSSVLRPKLTDRASDPERVEFTEQDAIHVSYTSNPMDSLSRNGEKQNQQTDRRYVKPASAPTSQQQQQQDDDIDDEEDEELMQASSDVYGRVKANPNETPTNPTTEQKDTEEYCERICSNVQDEDEEVVCGSDGFMYTSEAQMECYASCLHIDVTIQSKGTCNQPL
ncbi:myb-like protein AA [Episyrphus balteatus]|uniref:myb-like protein AA n=1 Tax=Episyrphus balteatus TaxID=286459 RepID=UPI002484E069|nr:myb-like protein AA [Episyrphus balteatus]